VVRPDNMASAIVLGFLGKHMPTDLIKVIGNSQDGYSVGGSDRLITVARATQLPTLQEIGFVLRDESDTAFTLQKGRQKKIDFAKVWVDVYWGYAASEHPRDGIVGIPIAASGRNVLIDWEPKKTGFLISKEKLDIAESFKAKIAAEFPVFAKAEIYSTFTCF